jgi:hypothetical protein
MLLAFYDAFRPPGQQPALWHPWAYSRGITRDAIFTRVTAF